MILMNFGNSIKDSKRAMNKNKVLFFLSVLYRNDLFSDSKLGELCSNLIDIGPSYVAPVESMQEYYSKEMGNNLKRVLVFEKCPLERLKLVGLKKLSFKVEESFRAGGRTANIDPGYLGLEHVVLSSFKPYAHRMSLSERVYGELELIYERKEWITLPWTYPDYAACETQQIFTDERTRLKKAIRS